MAAPTPSAQSYPLHWPLYRARTKHPRRAPFKTSLAVARDGLLDELRLLGAKHIVISTNIQTYRRGNVDIPYASQPAMLADPGVAVYFTWRDQQYAFSCDEWKTVADNMQAIRKTIEALRGIERWGAGEMVRAAFHGFKALPAPGGEEGRPPWWEVLGIAPDADEATIRAAYRARAAEAHPDRGGSTEAFVALQAAYKEALAARGKDPVP